MKRKIQKILAPPPTSVIVNLKRLNDNEEYYLICIDTKVAFGKRKASANRAEWFMRSGKTTVVTNSLFARGYVSEANAFRSVDHLESKFGISKDAFSVVRAVWNASSCGWDLYPVLN